MEWSIEYRKLKKLGMFDAWSYYDLNFCKFCDHVILVDELLNHVICNSDHIYFNKNIGDLGGYRCTYKSENDINEYLESGLFRDIE